MIYNKWSRHAGKLEHYRGGKTLFDCFYRCTQRSDCFEIGLIKNITKGCVLYRKGTTYLEEDKNFTIFSITDEMRKSVMCTWTEDYGVLHSKGGCTENIKLGSVLTDKVYTALECNTLCKNDPNKKCSMFALGRSDGPNYRKCY